MSMFSPTVDHATHPQAAGIEPEKRRQLDHALRGLELAESNGSASTRVAALIAVAQAYGELGAFSMAEWYLHQALRTAREEGLVRTIVDVLCTLAEMAVAAAHASPEADAREHHIARERARDRGYEATLLAARATDRPWEIDVLMRVADILDRCGDHDDAVALHGRALELMTRPFLSGAAAGPHASANRHA
jgi:hypothetical protein